MKMFFWSHPLHEKNTYLWVGSMLLFQNPLTQLLHFLSPFLLWIARHIGMIISSHPINLIINPIINLFDQYCLPVSSEHLTFNELFSFPFLIIFCFSFHNILANYLLAFLWWNFLQCRCSFKTSIFTQCVCMSCGILYIASDTYVYSIPCIYLIGCIFP